MISRSLRMINGNKEGTLARKHARTRLYERLALLELLVLMVRAVEKHERHGARYDRRGDRRSNNNQQQRSPLFAVLARRLTHSCAESPQGGVTGQAATSADQRAVTTNPQK